MTTRKEKREAADLRREKIEKEIFSVMSDKIEEERLKGTLGVTQLEEALKEADNYVNKMIRQSPQESHMIRFAAVSVKNKLDRFFKKVVDEDQKNKNN